MSSENIPESTRTVIENAEAGDLLEFNRGVYSHWAVYIGKNRHINYGTKFFFSNLVNPSFTTHNPM